MDCLIQVYDKEHLDNLIAILSLKPKKLIFLYDSLDITSDVFKNFEKACKNKIPDLVIDSVKIDTSDIYNILAICKNIIHKNFNCYFDVTGANGIIAIAVYMACKKNFTPLFTFDVDRECIINIIGCHSLAESFSLPKISLETLLLSHGASYSGPYRPTPNQGIFKKILTFCNAVFDKLNTWKELCLYLQTGISFRKAISNNLNFKAPKNISTPTGNVVFNDTELLTLAESLGFINRLNTKGSSVSFSFQNKEMKKYMTDFGIWLELYVYITLKNSNLFHDVRFSTKINWEGEKKGIMEITNEVDITFFSGIHPVFVSCKLSAPTSEALQELSVYRSYFGGKYSKSIVVTLAVLNSNKSYITRRAKDMDISIIDGKYMQKKKFINKIKEILGR